MLKKSILFLVPYPYNTAPSQRLKFEQYYSELEKHGYDITHNSFFDHKFWNIVYHKGELLKKVIYTIAAYLRRYYLLRMVRRYDIVYVHLWATPLGFPLYESLLKLVAKKIVYDIDDLVYEKNTSPANWYIRLLKTPVKINFLFKNSDQILVSTKRLEEYALQYNNNITFIPATIDVNRYPIHKHKGSKIRIGWSGSHTTSKYLHLLDNTLRKLSENYDIEIIVLGDMSFCIPGVTLKLIKWEASTEIENICSFDIGLHPIPDEDWVYGKSGGKLVQYMAAGIPIIASAIGPNLLAIKDGYNGFLVKSEDEWLSKLILLITNDLLREEMGKHSRIRAEEFFSVEANANKYLSALSDN